MWTLHFMITELLMCNVCKPRIAINCFLSSAKSFSIDICAMRGLTHEASLKVQHPMPDDFLLPIDHLITSVVYADIASPRKNNASSFLIDFHQVSIYGQRMFNASMDEWCLLTIRQHLMHNSTRKLLVAVVGTMQ